MEAFSLIAKPLFTFFSFEEVCDIPMDTTFVFDSSLCDDNNDWNRLLNYVQYLVSFFWVPYESRIALVQFSTDAKVLLKFDTSFDNFLYEVRRRVGQLKCLGGSRRIDKALELVDKEVLTAAGGMKDILRVLIII